MNSRRPSESRPCPQAGSMTSCPDPAALHSTMALISGAEWKYCPRALDVSAFFCSRPHRRRLSHRRRGPSTARGRSGRRSGGAVSPGPGSFVLGLAEDDAEQALLAASGFRESCDTGAPARRRQHPAGSASRRLRYDRRTFEGGCVCSCAIFRTATRSVAPDIGHNSIPRRAGCCSSSRASQRWPMSRWSYFAIEPVLMHYYPCSLSCRHVGQDCILRPIFNSASCNRAVHQCRKSSRKNRRPITTATKAVSAR